MTSSELPGDGQLTDLSFTVNGFISRPPSEVFEAVADPQQLSAYFTTGEAHGRLETGAEVSWDFHDFPGRFEVRVGEVVAEQSIELFWASSAPLGEEADTRVLFEFVPVDGGARTEVRITESAWPLSVEGSRAAFGNCMGWTGMLAAMKMWLEYGINLREGFYK
ncbi:SRPBCC domain-containing protein [Glutamicibacter sp. X7]